MQRIEGLLRKTIGLDAASIGSSLVERTVRLRMKAHGLNLVEAYLDLLTTSADELRELIEAVVVTETWFFRDREPFNTLVQLAREQWLPRHAACTLRVLSAPCSSGEEPYSVAMALLDAGLPGQRFAIDAVDISSTALARAARAVYGRNSFRGRDLAFRARHFQQTPEGYALNPPVQARVKLQRANILDSGFLAGHTPYDFIFCRNLLIYLDRATQSLVLEKLESLLADDGILFVGPAEMPLIGGGGFVSANFPLAFACRKAACTSLPASRPWRHPGSQPNAGMRQPASNTRSTLPQADGATRSSEANHHGDNAPSDLETARHLADTGRLDEAVALCEAHLAQCGPSAGAYYLLGLIKDAGDDPDAAVLYRKALYLEPTHYEALVHTALWLEKNGDAEAARPFRRRAERAQPREVTAT